MMTRSGWCSQAAVCLLTLGMISALGGCAPKPDKSAWKEYAEQLRPEVGHETIETYVKRWGTPHQRIDVKDGELYCWRISHGSTSGGVGYIVSVGKSYEAYDDIRLKFNRDKTMVDWTVDCIR